MVFLYQKIKLLQFTFKSGHFVVGLNVKQGVFGTHEERVP